MFRSRWFLTLTLYLIWIFWIITVSGDNLEDNSIVQPSVQDQDQGYVAEWSFEGISENEIEEFEHFSDIKSVGGEKMDESPSKRIGPGTWLDSNGDWWIFGGQGPTTVTNNISSTSSTSPNSKTIQFHSDLWRFDGENSWRQIFKPQITPTESPTSAYPENLSFPLLCGSLKHSHIALFNPKNFPQSANNDNNGFSDDNLVWVYDIPKEKSASLNDDKGGSESLWTSIVCCDTCLPTTDEESNGGLEPKNPAVLQNVTSNPPQFCPHFMRNPILWCGQDSIMALQLNDPKQKGKGSSSSKITSTGNVEEKVEKVVNSRILRSTEISSRSKISSLLRGPGGTINQLTTSNTWETITNNDPDHVGPSIPHRLLLSLTNDGNLPKKSWKKRVKKSPISGITADEIQILEEKNPKGNRENYEEEMTRGNDQKSENKGLWWKFDLGRNEWEQLPQIQMSKKVVKTLQNSKCRSVSDQGRFLYILCADKPDSLQRDVLIFDQEKSVIDLLPQRIILNNAFSDERLWNFEKSILSAHSIVGLGCNQTLVFLAYQKLLDVWIHDHLSNKLLSVENLWKGESLRLFQHSNTFYKISVSTSPSVSSGSNHLNFLNSTNFTFFMINPRSKLSSFGLKSLRFHINILADRGIFLPSRNSSFTIASKPTPSPSPPSSSSADDEKDQIISENVSKTYELLPNEIQTHGLVGVSTTSTSTTTSNIEKVENSSIPEAESLFQSKNNTPTITTTTTTTSINSSSTKSGITGNETKSTTFEMRKQQDDVTTTTTTFTTREIALESSTLETFSHGTLPSNQTQNQMQQPMTITTDIKTISDKVQRKSNQNLSLTTAYPVVDNLAKNGEKDLKSQVSPRKSIDDSISAGKKKRIIDPRHGGGVQVLVQHEPSNLNSKSPPGDHLTSLSPPNNPSNNQITSSTNSKDSAQNTQKIGLIQEMSPQIVKLQTQSQVVQVYSGKNYKKGETKPLTQLQPLPLNLAESSRFDSTSKSSRKNLNSNRVREINVEVDSGMGRLNEVGKGLIVEEKGPTVDEDHQNDDGQNDQSISDLGHGPNPNGGQQQADKIVNVHNYDEHPGIRQMIHMSSSSLGSDNSNSSNSNPNGNTSTSYNSSTTLIFFALSLSIFATMGITLFFRRCVKCPQNILLKEQEQPNMHYTVVPEEVSFHHSHNPIV